ncbi:hypothetical protein P3F83_15035 [Mycobacteroides immunogenum]|uniref:hypothetical protein n=1 Tax=Mycobacteroides immunogenum TaxID=83262 RepID=UPI0025B76948|nr:hypothetical protein [Mycobacteroides immunogenum]WJR31884.1 hypothetical protein P3F83_15035 [Mycobacteroides immunogenum]
MNVDYQHARDIPNLVFLSAIKAAQRPWRDRLLPATRWDVAQILAGRSLAWPPDCEDVPGVPGKVVLAKFRRIERRGLARGCDCGCRGDFELTATGLALVGGQ